MILTDDSPVVKMRGGGRGYWFSLALACLPRFADPPCEGTGTYTVLYGVPKDPAGHKKHRDEKYRCTVYQLNVVTVAAFQSLYVKSKHSNHSVKSKQFSIDRPLKYRTIIMIMERSKLIK